MMRILQSYLMISTASGLGGAFFWGRDRYRIDGNINDTMVHSFHGFMFYGITWLATIPKNMLEKVE